MPYVLETFWDIADWFVLFENQDSYMYHLVNHNQNTVYEQRWSSQKSETRHGYKLNIC